MAAFRATFFTIGEEARAETSSTMPVPHVGRADEERLTDLTTSASSQVVQHDGGDWTAPTDGFLALVCDGAVNIAAGASPTAAATAGFYLPASTWLTFAVAAGHKLAVIDA